MRVLVAEIYGEYAHFKAHETTRENLSYPIPPRTTLIGMIAGILGIPRNIYWKSDHKLRDLKIGLQIINPIRHYFMKVNYQASKSTISLGRGMKILLHPDPAFAEYENLDHKKYLKKMESPKARGQNMPVRLDLLNDVRYRVFIHSDDDDIFSDLKFRLENHKYVYPPYLGHANLFANWEYFGEFETSPVSSPSKCDSIVPFDVLDMDKMDFSGVGNPILYNLPVSMIVKDEKKEITLANVTLEKVKSVFLSDHHFTFHGYFKYNEIHSIKFDNNEIRFSFLPA